MQDNNYMRGYYHVKAKIHAYAGSLIREMLADGKSHREIEEFFGLTGDRPVYNLLRQERRKEAKLRSGMPPK